jgi:hypothetical protein
LVLSQIAPSNYRLMTMSHSDCTLAKASKPASPA